VVQLNEQLDQVRNQMNETAEHMPMLKSMAEFVNSIMVKQTKAEVTITAKMAGKGSMGMMFAPMMMVGVRSAPQPMVDEPTMIKEAPDQPGAR